MHLWRWKLIMMFYSLAALCPGGQQHPVLRYPGHPQQPTDAAAEGEAVCQGEQVPAGAGSAEEAEEGEREKRGDYLVLYYLVMYNVQIKTDSLTQWHVCGMREKHQNHVGFFLR